MPAHQEYNRNFVSSLIMMQEKHYVHEVVENIIRSAIPEDHWELIQYIYCDVEYKNIELKDLDYHILINTTFSKKKIDLVIKMYDIYIDEFNKIRDLQEKKRNVSRFVFIKFILNVESLFVNRQWLLVELLFIFITCIEGKTNRKSKATVCYLLKNSLQILFTRYLNNRKKTGGQGDKFDLYCLLFKEFNVKNNFLVSKEFLATFFKQNKITPKKIEILTETELNLLIDTLLTKLAVDYVNTITSLENKTNNVFFTDELYVVQEARKPKEDEAINSYLDIKIDNMKNRRIFIKNPIFEKVYSINMFKNIRFNKLMFNSEDTLDGLLTYNLYYLESFYITRQVVKNNKTAIIELQNKILKEGKYTFVDAIQERNNTKHYITKEYFNIFTTSLTQLKAFKNIIGYDNNFIKNYINDKTLLDSYNNKELIFNNIVLTDPTSIDHINQNIKKLLEAINRFSQKKKITKDDKLKIDVYEPNKCTVDALYDMEIKQKVFFLKDHLDKIMAKIINVNSFVLLCDTLFNTTGKNEVFFYINYMMCFRGRLYELSDISQSKSKLCRWAVYSCNNPITEYRKNKIGNQYSHFFKAHLDYLKNDAKFKVLYKIFLEKIGDNFKAIDDINNFLKKIEIYPKSYIFYDIYKINSEDLRAISILNIIITISIKFYKNSNVLHKVRVDDIIDFTIKKLKDRKLFIDHHDIYNYMIGDKKDYTYFGNIYDLLQNIKYNKPIRANIYKDSSFNGMVIMSNIALFKNTYLYKNFNVESSSIIYDPYLSLRDILYKNMPGTYYDKKTKTTYNLKELYLKYEIPRSLLKLLFMKRMYSCTKSTWLSDLKGSNFYEEVKNQPNAKEDLKIMVFALYNCMDQFLKNDFEINVLNIKPKTDTEYLRLYRTTFDFFKPNFAYFNYGNIQFKDDSQKNETFQYDQNIDSIVYKIKQLKKIVGKRESGFTKIEKLQGKIRRWKQVKQAQKTSPLFNNTCFLVLTEIDLILDSEEPKDIIWKNLVLFENQVNLIKMEYCSSTNLQVMTQIYDWRKTALGLSPNLIHSFDGEIIRKIQNLGFNLFISNHDSFGTHPSQIDVLQYYYNLALAEILINEDRRLILKKFFKKYTNEELKVDTYMTYEKLLANKNSLI